MIKHWQIFILIILHSGILVAQDFGKAGGIHQMDGLSDLEKVRFINENFYKLYSADFSNSMELIKWAVETSKNNGWTREEARANKGWGVVTYLSGDYKNVLPKYFRSQELFNLLNDKEGIAEINNEMAVFYHKQNDLTNAYKCLDVAEKNAREANNLEHLGTTLGHRGAFLSLEGDYEKAEPFYNEVYEIRKATNDSVGLGYVLLDLSELALKRGNIDQSFGFIDQSSEIRKKMGDNYGIAVNAVVRGENYFKIKQYRKAIDWFQQGLEQALSIGSTDLVQYTYDYLSKSYLALQDYKQAFELQEKAYVFKDSLFNIDQVKIIRELQAKYDAEKKDRQISELNKDNELKAATIQNNYLIIGGLTLSFGLFILLAYVLRYRKEQKQKARVREAQIKAVIESQERERERFAADLHEGMGQLVSALQLNIHSIRQNSDLKKTVSQVENSEQLLTEIQGELRNIVFNLMPPILMKEGLVFAVRELIRRLNKSGAISVSLTVHEVPNRFAQVLEISIYRILQELLSNITKHSNANEVMISFTGFENEVVIIMEDNGDGYDLTAFQNSEHSSGWRNIKTRINLIGGKIEFDTVKGRKNNTVIINVPLVINEEAQASEAVQ